MSFALLQTALLLPLERSINGVLALDLTSQARLLKLDGRTLALYASQPQITLYISVRSTGLHFAPPHDGESTASLHGTASALLGLLLRREHIDNLRNKNVELRGDTAFVQELQALLLDLDIDWEYQLGKIIGDIPTQTLASGLREAGAYIRKTGSRLREDVSDYLHEESGVLPTATELETFYHEISELQLRADRLQARLQQYLSTP